MKFPLFEEMETHLHMFVGKPTKQRASVIVDSLVVITRHSHVYCGVHIMNPFYNPSISNFARVAKCNDQKESLRKMSLIQSSVF